MYLLWLGLEHINHPTRQKIGLKLRQERMSEMQRIVQAIRIGINCIF